MMISLLLAAGYLGYSCDTSVYHETLSPLLCCGIQYYSIIGTAEHAILKLAVLSAINTGVIWKTIIYFTMDSPL